MDREMFKGTSIPIPQPGKEDQFVWFPDEVGRVSPVAARVRAIKNGPHFIRNECLYRMEFFPLTEEQTAKLLAFLEKVVGHA